MALRFHNQNNGKATPRMERISDDLIAVNEAIETAKMTRPRFGRVAFDGDGLASEDMSNLRSRGYDVDWWLPEVDGKITTRTTVDW
jgi:hypothetical protein